MMPKFQPSFDLIAPNEHLKLIHETLCTICDLGLRMWYF